MLYADQLEAKVARLRAALSRHALLGEAALDPIEPAARIVDYRHRAKLPVVDAGGAVHAGLYATPGRVVVDTPGCPVLHPTVREVLVALRAWLGDARLAGPAGPVTGVDVRHVAAAGACQVTLACRGGDLPGGARAARRLRRAIPGVATVAVSRADPSGFRVLGEAPRVLAGPASLEERVGATAYRLAPGAFFQVAPLQAIELVRRVDAALAGARRIADVYCGVGVYALALAPRCDTVVGIEESPEAVRAAWWAAKDAGLEHRVRFVEGAAEEVLERELSAAGGGFDGLVLNPTRRGADPRALAAIARAAPAAVAYVSCDPDSLARDLEILGRAGYRPARISPVDLFPQTFEVETVVALVRGAG
jgi:23S rRNA (uracil-5-)-methyltransferase RumA